MVVAGAFEFKLVEATTKLAFNEHTNKDGKTYVEAEPGAEYFISVKKLLKTDTDVSISYSVDSQAISGSTTYKKNRKCRYPNFKGIRNVANGVSSHTSFVFMKPKMSLNGSTKNNPHLLMGNVEIKLYLSVCSGPKRTPSDFSTHFKAASVSNDVAGGGASKKKNIRSAEGTAVVSKVLPHKKTKHKKSTHLDTITLNYCSALGLMEVGVLKKPSEWEHHRMKHPAKHDSNSCAVKCAKFEGDTIDLSHEDSEVDE